MIFATIVSAMPYVKSGKLRALGVTSARRSPSVPAVPTIAEAGVPGYESTLWYGAVLPAGVPRNIVTLLNAELVKLLNMADIRERFLSLGADPVNTTPGQFGQYIRAEITKWGRVVKDAGIKGEWQGSVAQQFVTPAGRMPSRAVVVSHSAKPGVVRYPDWSS